MKQTVSIHRTAEWGSRQEDFIGLRIKNKEEKKIENTSLAGATLSTLFVVRRNKEISIEPRAGLAFGDWVTGYTACFFFN